MFLTQGVDYRDFSVEIQKKKKKYHMFKVKLFKNMYTRGCLEIQVFLKIKLFKHYNLLLFSKSSAFCEIQGVFLKTVFFNKMPTISRVLLDRFA